MILAAALLLLHPFAIRADAPRDAGQTAVPADDSKFVTTNYDRLGTRPVATGLSFLPGHTEKTAAPPAESTSPDSSPQPVLPAIKPKSVATLRVSTKRWWALSAAMHGAAGFDAWTTRRFMINGTAQEANPFFKPFASSNAIYAATQVVPVAFDFLSRHMMHSEHPIIRRFWWAPQSIAAAASFASGMHNLSIH